MKKKLAAVWHGLVAAVTSPTAVKQEKSLAALVAGRVLLAAGASAGIVEIVQKLISAS